MSDKLKSRKFLVWITTTILFLISMIVIFITKTDALNVVSENLSEGYIWVSVFYIGGNTAQKFLYKKEE